MTEAEVALRRWKSIYDELVQADRELMALAVRDGREVEALRGKVARLTQQSDAALAELTKCIEALNGRRQSAG